MFLLIKYTIRKYFKAHKMIFTFTQSALKLNFIEYFKRNNVSKMDQNWTHFYLLKIKYQNIIHECLLHSDISDNSMKYLIYDASWVYI